MDQVNCPNQPAPDHLPEPIKYCPIGRTGDDRPPVCFDACAWYCFGNCVLVEIKNALKEINKWLKSN
jgi:hypothetical protein